MSKKSLSRSPEAIEDRTTPEIEPEEIPTSRRQISLVERVELNVSASRLSSNAIVLGDIDNDPQKVRSNEKAQHQMRFSKTLTVPFFSCLG